MSNICLYELIIVLVSFPALVLGRDKDATGFLNQTLSRTDIANFALTTYESASRKLRVLYKEKIIDLDNKSIAILNFDELKRLAKQLEVNLLISSSILARHSLSLTKRVCFSRCVTFCSSLRKN